MLSPAGSKLISGSSRLFASCSNNPSIPLSPSYSHLFTAYPSSVQGPYWLQELSAGALGPWSCCRLGICRVPLSLPSLRHTQAPDLCSVPTLGVPFCRGKGRDTALGQMSGYSLVGPASAGRIWGLGGSSTASASPGMWLQLLAAAHATSSPHSPSAPGSFCSLFHHLLWPQLSSAQEAAPAPLQVTAALPSGVLGFCWAPGSCLGPAAPTASPSLGAGSSQGTTWSVGQVAYVGHTATSPLPRPLCGCLGMFGNGRRLNPALLRHWERQATPQPASLNLLLDYKPSPHLLQEGWQTLLKSFPAAAVGTGCWVTSGGAAPRATGTAHPARCSIQHSPRASLSVHPPCSALPRAMLSLYGSLPTCSHSTPTGRAFWVPRGAGAAPWVPAGIRTCAPGPLGGCGAAGGVLGGALRLAPAPPVPGPPRRHRPVGGAAVPAPPRGCSTGSGGAEGARGAPAMGVRRLLGLLLAACAALLGPGPGPGCLARKWGRGPGSRRSALRDGAALPGTSRPPPPLELPPPSPVPQSLQHPSAPRSAPFPRSPRLWASGRPGVPPPAPRPGPPRRSPRARAGPRPQSPVTPRREPGDARSIARCDPHPVLPRPASRAGRTQLRAPPPEPRAAPRGCGREGGGGPRPNACSSAGPGGSGGGGAG